VFMLHVPSIHLFNKYWSQEKKQMEELIEKHRQAVKEAIEVQFMRFPISLVAVGCGISSICIL
jgi:hypothetical protein